MPVDTEMFEPGRDLMLRCSKGAFFRHGSRAYANLHTSAVTSSKKKDSDKPKGSLKGRWHSNNGDSERYTTGEDGIPRDRFFFGIHTGRSDDSNPLASLDPYGTLHEKRVKLTPEQVLFMYTDARERTVRLLEDLSEEAPEFRRDSLS